MYERFRRFQPVSNTSWTVALPIHLELARIQLHMLFRFCELVKNASIGCYNIYVDTKVFRWYNTEFMINSPLSLFVVDALFFIPVVRGDAGTETGRRFFFRSSSLITFHCCLHHPSFSFSPPLPSPPLPLLPNLSSRSPIHLSFGLPLFHVPSTLSTSTLFVNRSLPFFPRV